MPLPSHVPASQPRRSAQSHAAILRAAADLAGRVGYAAASIEQIAEEAKVGKQTIYRWWPNKAALFIEVYRDLAPINLLAKDTGSLGGDLELLLTQLSRLYSTTPAGNILSGLIAEAQTAGELADQMRETYVVPRRAIVESIFARAAARGEIAPLRDPDLVSDLISGAVWFRLLLGKQQLDRKFKSHLIEMIQHRLADMPAGAAPGLHQRRRKREHRH